MTLSRLECNPGSGNLESISRRWLSTGQFGQSGMSNLCKRLTLIFISLTRSVKATNSIGRKAITPPAPAQGRPFQNTGWVGWESSNKNHIPSVSGMVDLVLYTLLSLRSITRTRFNLCSPTAMGSEAGNALSTWLHEKQDDFESTVFKGKLMPILFLWSTVLGFLPYYCAKYSDWFYHLYHIHWITADGIALQMYKRRNKMLDLRTGEVKFELFCAKVERHINTAA